MAGSKRQAEMSVASPSKVGASAKRSRTQYDYYDEDEVESYPNEQWSDRDMESASRMSLDDSDDYDERFMPKPFSLSPSPSSRDDDGMPWLAKYDKKRKVTEASPPSFHTRRPPPPPPGKKKKSWTKKTV